MTAVFFLIYLYPLVISHSHGKWPIEIDDFPIKTSIYRGISMAMLVITRWYIFIFCPSFTLSEVVRSGKSPSYSPVYFIEANGSISPHVREQSPRITIKLHDNLTHIPLNLYWFPMIPLWVGFHPPNGSCLWHSHVWLYEWLKNHQRFPMISWL
jgi:hypothetical protein